MKRTFSSLACMQATLPQLVDYAVGAGYDALEVRLDKQDHICGLSREELPLSLLQEKGVSILDLGTGVSLTDYQPEKIAGAKRCAELAAFVGAKGIRLFVGAHVKTLTETPNQNIPGIIRAVDEIAAFAEPLGVEVWLELHSWFSTGKNMKLILDHVTAKNVKLIWDVIHSVEFGESPEETMELVGNAIAHVHIKDGRKPQDPEQYRWQLTAHGAGELPTAQVLRLLKAAGYDGYLSLEWESAWHPELDTLYADIPALLSAYNAYMDQAE